MRLSMHEGDRGYAYQQKLREQGIMPRVFLNHDEQRWCYVADEDEGYVVRAVLDQFGKPISDFAKGEFVTERVKGHVRIELPGA